MNALRFNVAGLLKDPAGAAREYEVDVPPAAYASLLEDAKPVAGLAGRVRMMRTPRSIFVRGHLSTSVEVECGRCLTAVVVPLAFDVESEFNNPWNGAVRTFTLDYDAQYDDVTYELATGNFTAGHILYTVHAHRTRTGPGADVDVEFDVSVTVDFDGTGLATITLDGSRKYQLELESGDVIKL